MKQKYSEIIEEVLDEIDSALNNPKGLKLHQRRLSFSLSLGASTLIEMFLDKKEILKSGAKINHLWLKKKKENAKKLISRQVVSSIGTLTEFDKLLDLAYNIEEKRNELAYGKLVSEKTLRNLINYFFELKKEVEND